MILSGIVILVMLLQPENVLLPMLVMLSGIVILVRLLHPSNALSPMLVTLLPIVTVLRLVLFSNAKSSMSPEVMVTFSKCFFGILEIAIAGIVASFILQLLNIDCLHNITD